MLHASGHGDFRMHSGQVGARLGYALYTQAEKLPYRALAWGPGLGELWVGYGSMRLSDWPPGWYVLDFDTPVGGIMKLLVHIIETRGARDSEDA